MKRSENNISDALEVERAVWGTGPMALIPYAGFEETRGRGPSKHKVNPLSALELFRKGWDTVQIAAYHLISEAEALHRLNIERSAAKELPSPYQKDHS
ncbi:hypothetical protein ACFFTN_01340 [Aminobacter aganoensis]|uniref:Uncharacterized protein n=1 Tax=Aminobacter aganoensis TaxID=83264 RepID=A0A7X0F5H7_9HYPH|nr:hypothetical protein [Aminobacter aganoensis]MBB6353497.1 hypothetical protein [Aminobacter aganoensis]